MDLFGRFTVIPAIDLKGGRVVRLLRGEMSRVTVYGEAPVEAARQFEREGAELIHIVDLDGAAAGSPRNLEAIRAIRETVKCHLDVSGGLRTMESIVAVRAAGADIISLGSAAFLNPALLTEACRMMPGQVFGSVDARDGRLAIKGWLETSALTVSEAAARFKQAAVAAITLTDIARDGTETGANVAMFTQIARQHAIPVIASGGVATLDDVRALSQSFSDGVVGAISGRALYEGRFSLAEAIAAAS
ncbi:MAG: HisA/HisF-related TIM barrel protein [Candidatus Binataceae bacterium]